MGLKSEIHGPRTGPKLPGAFGPGSLGPVFGQFVFDESPNDGPQPPLAHLRCWGACLAASGRPHQPPVRPNNVGTIANTFKPHLLNHHTARQRQATNLIGWLLPRGRTVRILPARCSHNKSRLIPKQLILLHSVALLPLLRPYMQGPPVYIWPNNWPYMYRRALQIRA